jgi:hypothetical protein
MSGCRIGKIKFKSGGEVHRLHFIERNDEERSLMRAATIMLEHFKDGNAGHVIVMWDKDMAYSVGYRIGDDAPMNRALLPNFVADAIRRRMIETGDWES